MTIGAWLRARDPAPPEPLTARMLAALGSDALRDVGETGAVCLDAASRILDALMREERPGRESALDLLAADALVTCAFEVMGEGGEELDATTSQAMLHLAELAGADGRTVA